MSRNRTRPTPVGLLGVGLIARHMHTYLSRTGFAFDEIGVYDLSPASAARIRGYLQRSGASGRITVHDDAEQVIRSSDLMVFATVAGQPHVRDPRWFDHHPLVLYLSLRDLAPEILLDWTNVVDDVDHCSKADTSPHLAESSPGTATSCTERWRTSWTDGCVSRSRGPSSSRPSGPGVLDLTVGKFVHDEIARSEELNVIGNVNYELRRYG